jgi:acyl carrier protein
MPTATANTLSQQITELISKQVDIPQEQVSLDSDFEADLGFDSLERVEFLMAVEEKFDIQVPDETGSEIRTVRQAVDLIEQSLAQKKGQG